MRLNFATLLLPAYAAAAAINDNPTSKLINQHHFLAFQALQALRESREKRLLEVLSSSHASRQLKPDSAKSAKNDSKSSKAQCGSELADVKAELADVKAKLAALQQPQSLFAQAADKCVLDMSGDTPTIESKNFHGDTVIFTDRPFTHENTTSTSSWFNNFNELFNDGDGWPNTAMTFVNEDESVGVVVTAFVNGYIKDGEDNQTIYGYDLNQSDEQKEVRSLEEIMGGEDKVEFDHCSFFIDSDLTNPGQIHNPFTKPSCSC